MIAVDTVPEKLAHALALGVDHVVDARTGDTAARIHAITDGGADVAIEALGIAATTVPALHCLAKLGRLCSGGSCGLDAADCAAHSAWQGQ